MWKFSIAGFTGLTGFASFNIIERNKNTGRLQFILIPEILENYIGKLTKLRLSDQAMLSQDKVTHKCVKELCDVLIPHSEIKKEWNVQVISGNTINAFVLPDGSIYVYTGLLKILENLDELGFVLSHELSHVILRHSSEKITIGGLLSIFWILIQVYLIGDFDFTFIGNVLINLPLSRTAENEADIHAVKIMRKVGLDPESGISVMEKFGKNEVGFKLEILSTHPLSENRAHELDTYITSSKDEAVYEDTRIPDLRALFLQAKAEMEKS